LALLARWSVGPIVHERIPFVTIMGAVAVAVGFGGLYPALFAIVAGYIGATLLFDPRGAAPLRTSADWITLAGYLFACLTVTAFGLLMRRAQRKHQEAARELAALNLRKDEWLATVAHELRNPLAPIRHAVEILRLESSARPDLGLARDMIDRQVQHLSRLIDDLLAMDRIARDQLELRLSRIDLSPAIQRAVAASEPMISARGHELKVVLPLRPLYAAADADRLEQVLSNLIANAIKFTPPPGRIEIQLEQRGDRAELIVRDTGVGIDAETLPRVFEMFFQADPTQRGLGIGLALVRQLVSLHGGTVTAQSDGPGRGSTFIVHLPLVVDPRAAEEYETGRGRSHPAEHEPVEAS
jgi:signal transduction histidine kinase